MRRYFIFAGMFAAIGVGVAFVSPPAGAFVAHQDGVAKAAMATNGTIAVKHSHHKGTPPGWHHGRKVGWHGRGEPPGQAKKP
jgi:hypothetical protein